jgi:hypothetical protein
MEGGMVQIAERKARRQLENPPVGVRARCAVHAGQYFDHATAFRVTP